MSKPTPVLVIEYSIATVPVVSLLNRWPGRRHAVHDRTLTVLDADGEVGGYAAGVWLRFWYESEAPQQ